VIWDITPSMIPTDAKDLLSGCQLGHKRRRLLDHGVVQGKDEAKDCKKDASGNPVFEPKGKVYPACRPSSF
jgi:hypothetical protein